MSVMMRKDEPSQLKNIHETSSRFSSDFGKLSFNRQVIKEMLPKEVAANLLLAMEGRGEIDPKFADAIAKAMKEWALSHGATHFTHWFHPLRGRTAEKHDAFIEWDGPDEVIETFSGRSLLHGEPDASSFPSGGLRTTFEARGYTSWDPTSPAFLWKSAGEVTLCIPSVYFSWRGHLLDTKIPMLRSEQKLEQAVLRLLKLTGIEATSVKCTLGFEQEYFIIDRDLYFERPDLYLTGRTLFGADSPKGQELQDHYFGSINERVFAFMQDVEREAIKVGIPVKTRHNEVAPAQYELAAVYEMGSVALDHNLLLMELMEKVAVRHNLACLLHEKPFSGLNGSGKHCNWSLVTDTGINLFDPTKYPENEWHFLVLLTAICSGIFRHSNLLRASIGSAGNDHRLGGHEAPPAIISVYLGERLEKLLNDIEAKGSHITKDEDLGVELGLVQIPSFPKHPTDRNRTSPVAFTGNKFEFRALGSNANPSFPVTVINAVLAESLTEIVEEIEEKAKNTKTVTIAILDVIRGYLKKAKSIRFSGDNYSSEWSEEAKKRGLSNILETPVALQTLTDTATLKLFTGILNEHELKSRKSVLEETYTHFIHIEVDTLLDLFRTSIVPAAIGYQKELSETVIQTKTLLGSTSNREIELLEALVKQIDSGLSLADQLEKEKQHTSQAKKLMQELRFVIDQLEKLVDHQKWPFPKYHELLFQQ